ncbi:GDP-mannose:glycolipid 4-beta-D-mannosyltransferase [Subtercola lobariae]|uniref:GDP-mannose:glycolipid 4-beta-D-mannosyltransferase n=1 Tax=Subtercola lobariae TaxID=1588641 RepID=A0A917B2K7_9MICO|nr:GDP-mannose:glycolipid 4-beta-D-mannosyltransferase [Subtercola lobariae]
MLGDGGELIVQQSFAAPRPTTNPYLVLLAESLAVQPGISVRTFSWPGALFGRYDVFHLHWPDVLITGSGPVKSFGRGVLTALLLLRLRMTGVPLVRTLHNPAPHSTLTRGQRALLERIDAQTELFICLNAEPPPQPGRPYEVILHGHYRDWFARVAHAAAVGAVPVPGRLAFVGHILPYKGVTQLVDAFRTAGRVRAAGDAPAMSLHVAGQPRTPELEAQLRRLAELDSRVTLDLRFVGDAEFIAVVTAAEVVVLPYHELHNSGAVLAALSLDRPVLVPANPVTDALCAEVGPGWVYRYDGPLSAETLERALRQIEPSDDRGSSPSHYSPAVSLASSTHVGRHEHPDLSRRDWADAGARHVAAYRRALALRGAS